MPSLLDDERKDFGLKWPVERLARSFICSVGVILAMTGLAKIISAFGTAKLLSLKDPILEVSFRQIMVLAGVFELAISGICFFSNRINLQIRLTAWFATILVVYRMGLWFTNWQHPCPCLGNLTDALHISPGVADGFMKAMLGYLLIGSYATIFWMWNNEKKFQLHCKVRSDTLQ